MLHRTGFQSLDPVGEMGRVVRRFAFVRRCYDDYGSVLGHGPSNGIQGIDG